MSRDWKPGDVAAVRNNWGVWNVAICSVKPGGDVWQYGVSDSTSPLDAEARPLVVIDPEDHEQIERLQAAVNAVDFMDQFDTLQAALRSLVADPKPPEPQGLGAVVEDEGGYRWLRADGGWWSSDVMRARQYADIAAVKVLSEGVPQ